MAGRSGGTDGLLIIQGVRQFEEAQKPHPDTGKPEGLSHLEDLRRTLTNRRNVEPSTPVRERLTILINNVESLIRDPGDPVLERLFRDNFARFETYMAGMA